MKTISIQGKDYITVNERVKEFHRLYPNGSIVTRIVSSTDNSVTMEAKVIPDCSKPERFFTGIAHEVQSNGFINKTCHYENCETSCVGRCLGFLGIGIETSIASADEVDRAIEASPQYQAARKKALRDIDDWTIDQIKGFEMEFGKYKGLTLGQLIGDPKAAEWICWAISKEPKDERGEKVVKILKRFQDEVLSEMQNEETT